MKVHGVKWHSAAYVPSSVLHRVSGHAHARRIAGRRSLDDAAGAFALRWDDFYEIVPGRFAAATFDRNVHWLPLEMPANDLQRLFEW
jgi:hypothetical protein